MHRERRPDFGTLETGPRRRRLAYALAGPFIGGTLLVRIAIGFAVGDRPMVILFVLPILLSAYLGGLGAGLFATALAALATDWFLFPPLKSVAISKPTDAAQWLVFAACGVAISLLCEALHRHREAEARIGIFHASTLASLGEGIVSLDPSGRVAHLNAEAERLTGWLAAEAAGRPVADLLGPLAAGESPSRIVRRDGSAVPVDGRRTEVLGPRSERLGSAVVLRDATALRAAEATRAAAERALRESEEQFRAIFEIAPIGIAQADPMTARWIRVNRAMQVISGYSEGELLSMRIPDLTHTEDREEDMALLGAVIRGEAPSYTLEKRYVRKDGRIARVRVNVAVIRDAAGSPLRTVAMVEDVTKAREAEERLREREQVFSTMAAQAEDSIALVDAETGVFAEFNDATHQNLGYTREEFSGKAIRDIDAEIPSEQLAGHVAETTRGGRVFETRHRRKDGSVRDVRVSATPVAVRGREHLATIMSDITEEKRIRESLRHLNAELERRVDERTAELTAANRELDAFAYAVSHDLRAPLRALSGLSDALVEDYGEKFDGTGRLYVERITAASRTMGELIDGLLALSRSTRGEVRRDDVDLSALSLRILGELAGSDHGRPVAASVEPGMTARGDARMLEAALRNLLGNAWKYTSRCDRPEIAVFTEPGSRPTAYCVRDNGAGFDMTHSARLFQPFQRLHRKDEFPGIGIGLATVQRIVSRHGGQIRAEAEPGRGATFRFTLEPDTAADRRLS